ncbi:MAG: hypothetical protein JO020_03145 [Chloroflexi bacterium]|nr:hypothetical protein [Chloroflexota bacterium]MBV9893146.1 hypothetical protein [Chloroflexota bacterium]
MNARTPGRKLLATVDIRELNTLRWGPMRQMFPSFVEEIELGRYLKQLPGSRGCCAVEIAPHASSSHIFDVFIVDKPVATSQ